MHDGLVEKRDSHCLGSIFVDFIVLEVGQDLGLGWFGE